MIMNMKRYQAVSRLRWQRGIHFISSMQTRHCAITATIAADTTTGAHMNSMMKMTMKKMQCESDGMYSSYRNLSPNQNGNGIVGSSRAISKKDTPPPAHYSTLPVVDCRRRGLYHCCCCCDATATTTFSSIARNLPLKLNQLKTFSTISTNHSSDDSSSSSSSSITKDNHHQNHLVQHFQSLVDKGDASNDEFQLQALTQLDQVRNKILSKQYKHFYEQHPPATSTTASTTTTTTINTANPNKNNNKQSYTNNKNTSIGDSEENETSFPYQFMNQVSNFFSSQSSVSSLLSKPHIEGVYLHGGVGCGKTFCMNLFFDSLPQHISKQKVHFHSFMLNVHKQMHEAKMVEKIEGDVLPYIIQNTIKNGLIICFDEFQVTDVADALILRRLFTDLLDKGAIIVATSNRPPQDLYLNGLQRDLFLPFIDLLEEKLHVVSMWESDVDYRLVQGENKARGVYFKGDESKPDFEKAFQILTKNSSISTSTTLKTQGRTIPIPQSSIQYGIARFSFNDLCREARGAADYLSIGEAFHTVFIEDVPMLTMNDVNLVRRFIIFVDSMYESHVKLIVHAASNPGEIFKVDLDNEFCDEAFAFDRTRSRLEEMGSDEYLKKRWKSSSK